VKYISVDKLEVLVKKWDEIIIEWESKEVINSRLDAMLGATKTCRDVLRSLIADNAEQGEPGELLHQIELTLEDWKQHGHRDRAEYAKRILDRLPTPSGDSGLREALIKLTIKMNKVTARWRHTKQTRKEEMDDLCNAQLDAEAALNPAVPQGGEKPGWAIWRCDECGAPMGAPGYWQGHVVLHCGKCGAERTISHDAWMASGKPPAPPAVKRWRCEECGIEFSAVYLYHATDGTKCHKVGEGKWCGPVIAVDKEEGTA